MPTNKSHGSPATLALVGAMLLVSCTSDGRSRGSAPEPTLAPATADASVSADTSAPTTTVTTATIVTTTITPTTTAQPSSTVGGPVSLPDTPAGAQLAWVLASGATATDEQLAEHFAPEFLAQVPAAQLREGIATADVGDVLEIVESESTSLVVVASSGGGDLLVSIVVSDAAPHLIIGLLAQPMELPDPPTSWEAIEAGLADAAPSAAMLAAEISPDGTLAPIRTFGSDEPVPLGSGFKLYVLGALLRAIEEGAIAWDDELVITDALKSLPSGELQDRPSGSTVSVHEAAEKMIQISDNTATDLLIDRLGRDAVETILQPMGMGDESRNRTLPFLTTRELFTLKWGVEASLLGEYASADTTRRRAILDSLGDELPAVAAFDPNEPIAIDTVEWFATPSETIAAHVWLDAYRGRPGFEPLDSILGTNPGVEIDPGEWNAFAFKGGSEPGVVFLGWLLVRADGRQFGVVLSAANPNAIVDDLQLASIGQGTIELLAAHA